MTLETHILDCLPHQHARICRAVRFVAAPAAFKADGACSNVNGLRLSPWQVKQPGSLAVKICVIAGRMLP